MAIRQKKSRNLMGTPSRSGDTTVRVDRSTSGVISRLSREIGLPRKEIIALAVERLRRHRVLASANAGFAAMKRDSAAWRDELEDRAGWETTLADGLADE
jgi:hypothetical protein